MLSEYQNSRAGQAPLAQTVEGRAGVLPREVSIPVAPGMRGAKERNAPIGGTIGPASSGYALGALFAMLWNRPHRRMSRS